jgi:hypothetical protein
MNMLLPSLHPFLFIFVFSLKRHCCLSRTLSLR